MPETQSGLSHQSESLSQDFELRDKTQRIRVSSSALKLLRSHGFAVGRHCELGTSRRNRSTAKNDGMVLLLREHIVPERQLSFHYLPTPMLTIFLAF